MYTHLDSVRYQLYHSKRVYMYDTCMIQRQTDTLTSQTCRWTSPRLSKSFMSYLYSSCNIVVDNKIIFFDATCHVVYDTF